MTKSRVYDVFKFIAQIALPAAITLYGTLAAIWGWPYRDAIIASAAAVDTFLGAVLMIDSANFFKANEIVPKIPDDLKKITED